MSVTPLAVGLAFLFGLCVGSFLNVCIWRLPAGEQVFLGRSRCRSCGKTIAWYDNIPLLSFCLLRARCRFCRARISVSYPLVELATGLLFAGLLVRFGFSALAFVYGALGAALIFVSVVDLKTMTLPDEVTLPGILLGVILSFYVPALHGTTDQWGSLWTAVLGTLVGTGVIFATAVLGKWVFRRKLAAIGEEEAMGLGDVKLMAMIGSVIGPIKVLLVSLALAPLLGSVVGLVLKLRYKQDLIPYGPFLSLGTLVAIFWADDLIAWYRGLLF